MNLELRALIQQKSRIEERLENVSSCNQITELQNKIQKINEQISLMKKTCTTCKFNNENLCYYIKSGGKTDIIHDCQDYTQK